MISEPPPLPTPAPEPPKTFPNTVFAGGAILFAGLFVFFAAGVYEAALRETHPGAKLALFPESAASFATTVPAWFGRIDDTEHRAPESELLAGIETLLEDQDVSTAEWVLAAPLSGDQVEALVATGRPAQPEAREVLAGPLVRRNTFAIGPDVYTVTGSVHAHVPYLGYSYFVPLANANTPALASRLALDRLRLDFDYDPTAVHDAAPDTEEAVPAENEANAQAAASTIGLAAPARAPDGDVAASFVAMLLCALGGMLAHLGLYEYLRPRTPSWIAAALGEAEDHRTLFVGLHALCYGIYGGAMVLSITEPRLGLYLAMLVQQAFTTGELSYITDAYISGNPLVAAAATFYNNYVQQTLVLTLLPSLVVPLFGVFKTCLSLFIVGLAMSPGISGFAAGFSFHAVTVVLELEAYIFAAFMSVRWPIRFVTAFGTPEPKRALAAGLRCYAGCAVIVGVTLALAGLYEGVTLILAAGF